MLYQSLKQKEKAKEEYGALKNLDHKIKSGINKKANFTIKEEIEESKGNEISTKLDPKERLKEISIELEKEKTTSKNLRKVMIAPFI